MMDALPLSCSSPASASGFPVPRADCCGPTPYRHNSLPLEIVLAALFDGIGVDFCGTDGLMLQSPAISSTAAAFKSP